ncbi:hypothetical protein NESM_000341800 [Novymonas esmeraldas]|uniref:Uncharacterized protein n=1 Tax=Novymonas esmeraldas TaxID=1808958 RepID=A0AAW0EN28_9TRYP
MAHQRTRRAAVAAAVCLVSLCVLAAAAVSAASAPTAAKGAAAAAVPSFEKFFAQSFHVSVMTQSYGSFNATLRMRGSLNFPERVQGELTPMGEPRLSRATQRPLPHFLRARGVEDDRLSSLPFAAAAGGVDGKRKKKGGADSSGSGEFAVAGEEERPTLLVMDMQLQYSDAMNGVVSVYYLPAELMALRAQREAIGEGSATPSASVDFAFRTEAEHMTGTPLSDVSALARVSSAVVSVDRIGSAAAPAGDPAANQGGVIFRWITEHEFSALLTIPITDDAAAGAAVHVEHMWVYGYAVPSKTVFSRNQRQVPWYNKYLMVGVGLMGFVVQIISGVTEGKKRAQEAAGAEAQLQAQQKAQLEAQLLEQERTNKKKK